MKTKREHNARGGDGRGCLGTERSTWILRLCARAVSSRRGNCVLKKKKNQAHDSHHCHDCFYPACTGRSDVKTSQSLPLFKDVIM